MKKIIVSLFCLLVMGSPSFAGQYEFAEDFYGELAAAASQNNNTVSDCPVFTDYLDDAKTMPKSVQIGGLCYAHAAATMLTLNSYPKHNGGYIVSPVYIAQLATNLPSEMATKYHNTAFADYYKKAKNMAEDILKNDKDNFLRYFKSPIRDLIDLYGLKEVFAKGSKYDGQLSLKIFLISNALIDRIIYETGTPDGQKNYDDYVKTALTVVKVYQMTRSHTKGLIVDNDDFTDIRLFFPDYDAVKDQIENNPDLKAFIIVSKMVKKEKSKDNYWTYDGGAMGSVARAVNGASELCVLKTESFKTFNFMARNRHIFFGGDDAFGAAVAQVPDGPRQFMLETRKQLQNSGANAFSGNTSEAVRGFQNFTLQRIMEREQKKMCKTGERFIMTKIPELGFEYNTDANFSVTKLLQARRPIVISYKTVYHHDGHAVAVVGVEKRDGQCVAVIQDSNSKPAPAENKEMNITDDVGDGFWRVPFASLDKGTDGVLFVK
ncbi:MAG: hypothetical protein FWF35_04910 [Elusimicrobia bacterium]|nr:hypothetical protein [Elusimicrobiota bacterium]